MEEQELHPDVQAAIEYAARAASGKPSDRWTDGTEGDMAVARGIARLVKAVETTIREEQLRGELSMTLGPAKGSDDE